MDIVLAQRIRTTCKWATLIATTLAWAAGGGYWTGLAVAGGMMVASACVEHAMGVPAERRAGTAASVAAVGAGYVSTVATMRHAPALSEALGLATSAALSCK